MDGEPIAGAVVVFSPLSGSTKPCYGETSPEGTFELTTYETNDGAVPGEYRVSVVKSEFSKPPEGFDFDNRTFVEKEIFLTPKRYADFEKSGLTATVTASKTNNFEFRLEN